MSVHTEPLFTSVKNNYHICITVGLDHNFSLKTASVAESFDRDEVWHVLIFFNPYEMERDPLNGAV